MIFMTCNGLIEEREFSEFNFNYADIKSLQTKFSLTSREAEKLIEKNLLFPAYDMCLKSSHLFNLLDSRGAVSVTERVKKIAQIRNLVTKIAQEYISREGSC